MQVTVWVTVMLLVPVVTAVMVLDPEVKVVVPTMSMLANIRYNCSEVHTRAGSSGVGQSLGDHGLGDGGSTSSACRRWHWDGADGDGRNRNASFSGTGTNRASFTGHSSLTRKGRHRNDSCGKNTGGNTGRVWLADLLGAGHSLGNSDAASASGNGSNGARSRGEGGGSNYTQSAFIRKQSCMNTYLDR